MGFGAFEFCLGEAWFQVESEWFDLAKFRPTEVRRKICGSLLAGKLEGGPRL